MRNPRKMAIIGAGIAGLSAGIYAQTHGFSTTIFEKNRFVGGSLHGWTANGVALEGSLRLLVGTKEGSPLFRCWQEVGALGGTMIFSPECFFAATEGGHTAVLWQDLDRFAASCEALAPEDGAQIQKFCGWVRTLQGFSPRVEKPADLCGPLERRRSEHAGEAGRLLAKLNLVPLAAWAEGLHMPALRRAFVEAVPPGASLGELVLQYAYFTGGDSGLPMGGARPLVQRMAQRYLEVGGDLQLSTPVEEILISNGTARGLQLQEGRRVLANWVLAACDPFYVSRALLKSAYNVDRRLQARWDAPAQYPPVCTTRLLFWADGDALPPYYTFSFPTTVVPAAGGGVDRLRLTQYGEDPTFVRGGRELIAVDVPTRGREAYAYWETLALQGEPYLRERRRLTESVADALVRCFPQLSGSLEAVACHTPLTYADRTNDHMGLLGFVRAAGAKTAAPAGRVPSVGRLLLASTWCGETVGAHTALLQGKFAVERACDEERIDF